LFGNGLSLGNSLLSEQESYNEEKRLEARWGI
jgi:hypothetical protein